MTDFAELRDNFAVGPDKADTIKYVMNDADEVFRHIQEGQKMVTLNALQYEEANDTEKVSLIYILDQELALTFVSLDCRNGRRF